MPTRANRKNGKTAWAAKPRPKRSAKGMTVKAAPSLEDDLLAIGQSVPAEEWAKLPSDFNENLDHYLYGSPKD